MTTPVAIIGPTATGKTELGIRVAHALDGEVVNADAMQLYRGMDIGTAKASPAERQDIPHHLLDVLDVTEPASVAAYQRDARSRIEQLLASKKRPILVGGSGLYVQSVLDDLRFPGTDPAIRTRLEHEAQDRGTDILHARLATVDPDAAAKILPSNTRRIVRALEVVEITGQPFSAHLPTPGPPRYDTTLIGIDRAPAELDDVVNRRVQRMFEAGLVEEVRELEARGLREGKTASRALGYRQVLHALDSDNSPTEAWAEAARETARATRRFVRKQRSWFRRDKRIRWFDAATLPDLTDQVLSIVGP